MAKVKLGDLKPGATTRSPGRFLIRDTKHGPVAQAWPKPRGNAQTPYDRYKQSEFAIAARWASDPEPIAHATAINLTHGTQNPPRDFHVAASYGTLYRIEGPGDAPWVSYRMVAPNALLILDQISIEEGAMLYRDPDGWWWIPPGNSGQFLRIKDKVPYWSELPLAPQEPVEPPPETWSPLQIIGRMSLWLQGGTVDAFELDGTNVVGWFDRSQKGRHVAAQASQQGLLAQVPDFGDAYAVKFDGSNDKYTTPVWGQAQPFTIFAMYRTGSSVVDLGALWDGTVSTGFRLVELLRFSALSNKPGIFSGTFGGSWQVSQNVVLSTDTCYQQLTRYNGSGSFVHRNGGSPDPATIGLAANGIADGVTIGGSTAGGGVTTIDAHLAEFGIIDGTLDDATRQKVEGYLAHRYSRQIDLPSDHPYKTDPPEP